MKPIDPKTRTPHQLREMKYQFAVNYVGGMTIAKAGEAAGFSPSACYYQFHKIKPLIKKLEERVIRQSSRQLIASREEAYMVLGDVMRKAENQSDRTRAANALLQNSMKDEELRLKYSQEANAPDESKAPTVAIYLPEKNAESEEV